MSVCPSCGAKGFAPGSPCASCGQGAKAAGAPALPELELNIPKPPPPKPKVPKKEEPAEPIELAVDMASIHHSALPGKAPPLPGARAPGAAAVGAGTVTPSAAVLRAPSYRGAAAGPEIDEEDDAQARALANYGDLPKHWLLSPLYAYRVLTRQKELKGALVLRRDEATEAATMAEDALIACAERVRARAAADEKYKPMIASIMNAEDLLRSRDGALAKEQDAHAQRVAQIDARISAVEGELAAAQVDERRVAGELAEAEAALQRAEAKVKRAEIEMRNATEAAKQQGGR
jgi:hypothetical protein